MAAESAVSDEDFRDDRLPDDIRDQAKVIGLFGYAIPHEWGGLGLDITQDVELALDSGYTSLAVQAMFGTNNGIAGLWPGPGSNRRPSAFQADARTN